MRIRGSLARYRKEEYDSSILPPHPRQFNRQWLWACFYA